VYFKWLLKEEFQRLSGIQDLSAFEDQGGFAQYFVSHEVVCLPIPSTVPPSYNDSSNPTTTMTSCWDPNWFVLAQPLGTVIHACERLDENIMGKTVAIVGQGQNGLLLTQLLAGYRPRRLIVLDTLQEQLQLAQTCYPVTHTVLVEQQDDDKDDHTTTTTKNKILQITNGELCDVVIDMAGHHNQSLDFVCPIDQILWHRPWSSLDCLPVPTSRNSPFGLATLKSAT
jgi:threonine dehydrogenase-like Zn-dependent dehydrogenase